MFLDHSHGLHGSGFSYFSAIFLRPMLANKYTTMHGAHKLVLKLGFLPFDRHYPLVI